MGWQKVCTAKPGVGEWARICQVFCILVCLFVLKVLTLSSFNYNCFPLIELVVFEEITVKTRLEGILLVV